MTDRSLYWLVAFVVLGRMVAVPHSVVIAEALVYVGLALVIAGYWSFSAWLRLQEKSTASPVDEVKKDVAEIKQRINGLLIKAGFGGL